MACGYAIWRRFLSATCRRVSGTFRFRRSKKLRDLLRGLHWGPEGSGVNWELQTMWKAPREGSA